MKSRGTTAVVAALLLALTGCAGDNAKKAPSVADWKAALADVGVKPRDWDEYVAAVKDTCQLDDYGMYVTLARPDGPSLNTERIGIKHACPERLSDWDEAVTELGSIQDRVDYLCSTPLEDLPAEDRDEAEAVC